jgi:hypothetical protein
MATIQKMTTPPLPTGTFLVWEEMSAESLSLCETLEGKFLFLEPLHIDGAVERYARLISAARLEMEPGPGTGARDCCDFVVWRPSPPTLRTRRDARDIHHANSR